MNESLCERLRGRPCSLTQDADWPCTIACEAADRIERLQADLSMAISLLGRPYSCQGHKRLAWNPDGYWIDGALCGGTLPEAVAKAARAAEGDDDS